MWESHAATYTVSVSSVIRLQTSWLGIHASKADRQDSNIPYRSRPMPTGDQDRTPFLPCEMRRNRMWDEVLVMGLDVGQGLDDGMGYGQISMG